MSGKSHESDNNTLKLKPMAKFLKVHHENDEGDIEEYIANLEMIIDVDEENHEIDMADSEIIHVARDNEWEKIMSFVKTNSL